MRTITFISDLKSTIIERLNDYAGGNAIKFMTENF